MYTFFKGRKLESKIRIGLLVDYLESEYSESLIKGLSTFCKTKGISLYIFFVGEIKNVDTTFNYQYVAAASFITQNNLDGVVITSGGQFHSFTKEEFVTYVKKHFSLPIVNISSQIPQIPSLVVDCKDAFSELIKFLIEKQHCRKFGLMGVKSNSAEVIERTNIFKEVLQSYNIPLSSVVFWEEDFSYTKAYLAVEKYYQKQKSLDLDAIVCLNDDMAFGCMDFCSQNNIAVPKEVIVTGFDDSERAAFFSPTLTSVNQSLQLQGYKAGESVYSLIQGFDVPIVQEVKANTVLRQSCEKYNVSDFYPSDNLTNEVNVSNDSSYKEIIAEWFLRRSQLYHAASIYADIQNDMRLDSFRAGLNDVFLSFGIKAAAVVMYESPIKEKGRFEYFSLPQNAYLISYFDAEMNVFSDSQERPIEFNPKNHILPPNCISETPDGLIVIALFHRQLQLGYIVVRRGNLDRAVYGLIAKSISAQLDSVFAFSKIRREQELISNRAVQLDLIAHTDELTGLKNRRGLIEIGQASLNLSESMQMSGLVIYADMDGLKRINDRYGHEAGDTAIIAQSKILKKNFRSMDILARIAGDEFALVCPGLNINTFESIKKSIEKDCIEWKEKNNSPFAVSISLGYVEYPHKSIGYSITPLLAEADSNLYFEKRRKKELQNK